MDDGSGFGAVVDEGPNCQTPETITEPPEMFTERHAGGRPNLLSVTDEQRFVAHMKRMPGPAKQAVNDFLESNPWCNVKAPALDALWKRRK